jgi:hypothetical protein
MMTMIVEQSVDCLAGETKVLGENLPQAAFSNHKSHMTRPGLEPGRLGWKPEPNRQSYNTASVKQWKVFQLHNTTTQTFL